jgi:hypothetical protein
MDDLRPALRGALIALALAGAACASEARAALAGSAASPEEAARVVLDRLAARDLEGLRALAIDEHEFRRIVWPALPSSRPEANLPVEYAWASLRQTSLGALATTVSAHGGQNYQLLSVRFRGETTAYDGFTVHRDTELVVRERSGAARTIRVFGSMIERDGRWKVISFVTD